MKGSVEFLISRSSHEIGRGYPGRGLYLELERNGGVGGICGDLSPPSDNVLFDNQCYATTPSSSNGNSDLDQPSHGYPRRHGRNIHQNTVSDIYIELGQDIRYYPSAYQPIHALTHYLLYPILAKW